MKDICILLKKYKFFLVIYTLIAPVCVILFLTTRKPNISITITVPSARDISTYSKMVQNDFQSPFFAHQILKLKNIPSADFDKVLSEKKYHLQNYIGFNYGNVNFMRFVFDIKDQSALKGFSERFKHDFLPFFSSFINRKINILMSMNSGISIIEYKEKQKKLDAMDLENPDMKENYFLEKNDKLHIVPHVVKTNISQKKKINFKKALIIILFFALSAIPMIVYWEVLVAKEE